MSVSDGMLCAMSHSTLPNPEVAQILAAAEAFDWTTVSHAYGDATDVPAMLRALAVGDETGPDAPAGDLWGSICHQGTVYSASVATVPFLARLAVAGAATKECLWLLLSMAESDDTAPGAEDDVRRAVRAEIDRLLPLASHDVQEIRQAAVNVLGQSRSADVLRVLREVLERDPAPAVRAEALTGLVRCGAPDAVALIMLAHEDRDGEVRLASVFAAFDAGLPWTARLHDVVLSIENLPEIGPTLLDGYRHEPLVWLVKRLCARGEGRAAATMLLGMAEREPVDLSALRWAAVKACESSRIATEMLRPLAVRHADSDHGAWLAEVVGLAPPRAPLPLPRERSTDQMLGAEADLDVEEMHTVLAVPLPDYARLTTPVIDRKLAMATAVWERTGDASPVVSAVAEVVDRVHGRDGFLWGSVRAAARTAARLGRAAAPLEAPLRTLLDDPMALAAASAALVGAGCALDTDDIAFRLAAQVGTGRNDDTVAALAALRPRLSQAGVRRWHEVITQDTRLVQGGVLGTIIQADEEFRAALLDALVGTSGVDKPR